MEGGRGALGGGGQTLTLKVLAWPLKWGQGHLNLIISSTCPNGVAMQVKSKSTNWFRRYNAEKLVFTVFVVWWPWKLDQGHQNLIKSLNYSSITIDEVWPVWPESVIWFKR